MLMLYAAIAVAWQFITLQDPIPITVHPMKHGDQAGIKFMLFDRPIFIAIQFGKAVILARCKFVKADRTIVICIDFLSISIFFRHVFCVSFDSL